MRRGNQGLGEGSEGEGRGSINAIEIVGTSEACSRKPIRRQPEDEVRESLQALTDEKAPTHGNEKDISSQSEEAHEGRQLGSSSWCR